MRRLGPTRHAGRVGHRRRAARFDQHQRDVAVVSASTRDSVRTILFAGFAPAAISFAAGQAAFIGRSEVPEPVAQHHAADDNLVDAVRRDLRGEDEQANAVAVRIIWTGDHLDAARRLQAALVGPPGRSASAGSVRSAEFSRGARNRRRRERARIRSMSLLNFSEGNAARSSALDRGSDPAFPTRREGADVRDRRDPVPGRATRRPTSSSSSMGASRSSTTTADPTSA
jgi:hypothetical protein